MGLYSAWAKVAVCLCFLTGIKLTFYIFIIKSYTKLLIREQKTENQSLKSVVIDDVNKYDISS